MSYFGEEIIDIFDAFPELDNVVVVINLLKSIQKMLGNIANIFDLRFIYVIIINHLLPDIQYTQIQTLSHHPGCAG